MLPLLMLMDLGAIRAKSLEQSGIFVGAPDSLNVLPDVPAGINAQARLAPQGKSHLVLHVGFQNLSE